MKITKSKKEKKKEVRTFISESAHALLKSRAEVNKRSPAQEAAFILEKAV